MQAYVDMIKAERSISDILETICDWYCIYSEDRSFFVGDGRNAIYQAVFDNYQNEKSMREQLHFVVKQILQEPKSIEPTRFPDDLGLDIIRTAIVERVIEIWKSKQRQEFKDRLKDSGVLNSSALYMMAREI